MFPGEISREVFWCARVVRRLRDVEPEFVFKVKSSLWCAKATVLGSFSKTKVFWQLVRPQRGSACSMFKTWSVLRLLNVNISAGPFAGIRMDVQNPDGFAFF